MYKVLPTRPLPPICILQKNIYVFIISYGIFWTFISMYIILGPFNDQINIFTWNVNVFIYIVSNQWLKIQAKNSEFGWLLPIPNRSYSTYFWEQNPCVGFFLCDLSLHYHGSKPKVEQNNCISTFIELSGCLESGEIALDLRDFTRGLQHRFLISSLTVLAMTEKFIVCGHVVIFY